MRQPIHQRSCQIMNKHSLVAPASLLLLAVLAAAPASQAREHLSQSGLFPSPANRIVGVWNSDVTLRPCGPGPVIASFKALATFHAGGTLSDANNTPSALRTAGHGIWRYVQGNQYKTRFQIFRFLPSGAYDGYADVDTIVQLSGNTSTSTVVATNFNPDGTERGTLCGTANGTRLSID